VGAVIAEFMKQKLIDETALTANGHSIGENYRDATINDPAVIHPFDQPLKEIQRRSVSQLDTGAVLEEAVKFQRLAQTQGLPRHNH